MANELRKTKSGKQHASQEPQTIKTPGVTLIKQVKLLYEKKLQILEDRN